MKYAYSNQQMRLADAQTITNGTPSLELMERAGAALADAVSRAMKKTGTGDAIFVCGGGNNGGDGFVAAQILKERGEDVAVLCIARKFSSDCNVVRARYDGVTYERIPRRRYGVVVDCLFGTGLTRPVEGENALLIDFINQGEYVIACDLPSGLMEGGIAGEACVHADETVTMGLVKQALLLSDGADCAGEIRRAEIGIESAERGAQIWEESDVKKYFPQRKSNSNKGTYGTASIVACGSYSGATVLAARACLKSGAGYTKLWVDSQMYPYVVGFMPSVVTRVFCGIDDDVLSSDAIAVGMGAGVSDVLYDYLGQLLERYTGTLVLDADALNTIAKYGVEILKEKACNVVITPHPKEFSRLTSLPVREVLSHAVDVAKQFAKDYRLTVVLKNNRSVITNGERVAINTTGSPTLAKGGSGDVLAGLLCGTCARNVAPFEAGCVSSYLLGRAGEIVAKRMGEYSPDATNVIDALSDAIVSVCSR